MVSSEDKSKLNILFGDRSLDVGRIYNQIINIFPNYLTNTEERKAIYEKIEGVFHDGLGTLFEIEVCNCLIKECKLKQPIFDLSNSLNKINAAIDLSSKFKLDQYYAVDFSSEIKNIKNAAVEIVKDRIKNKSDIVKVEHTPNDHSQGFARDVKVTLKDNSILNLSLKTDKSRKVALAEIGQTPRIDKLFEILFNLKKDELETLEQELFGTKDFSIIRKDFQNVCLLFQKVLIKQFGLINTLENDFSNAKITNLENLKHFLMALKKHKIGGDKSIVLIADRETGEVSTETIIDEINTDSIQLNDFSMTDCKKKDNSKYKYTTTYGIKYKGNKIVDLQVKHKRGKYSSIAFGDITTRLTR